jgi:alpha-glucosidase
MDSQLKADVNGTYKDTNSLGNVTIMGVDSVGDVKLNGQSVGEAKVNFDDSTGVLKLSGLNDLTSAGAWSGSWTLSWN